MLDGMDDNDDNGYIFYFSSALVATGECYKGLQSPSEASRAPLEEILVLWQNDIRRLHFSAMKPPCEKFQLLCRKISGTVPVLVPL